MATVVPFPERGWRSSSPRLGPALRVSWHHDAGVVVLSLWLADTCTGTFRLLAEDVPGLLAALSSGLAAGNAAVAADSA